MLGVSLGVLRASPPSSRASSPPSAALATLAMTESAASGLDRSRPWCARNVAASRRNGDSAPSLQRCRGAEVQRCRRAMVQWCSGTVVQWCSGVEDCSRGAHRATLSSSHLTNPRRLSHT